MSIENVKKILQAVDASPNLNERETGLAWILRELGGAISDAIDHHGKETPATLRALERALRSVLGDNRAMDVLHDEIEE